MLKVLTLIDGSNLLGQCRNVQRRPDFPALVELVANPAEGRFAVDAYVYLRLSTTFHPSIAGRLSTEATGAV